MQNEIRQCSMSMIEIINKNPLFKGVPQSDLEQLFDEIEYKINRYKTKDFIALQGDSCRHLMIVTKGVVQGQMVDSTGRLIVIEEISAPFAIAAAFVFAEQNQLPVSVVALVDSEVLFIRKEIFTDLLQKNRFILQNFLQVISNRSKFLSDKIHFLTFRSLKSKIADYLLKLSKRSNSITFELIETQQQMADLFGVARPSLARTFKELELDGLIELDKKRVTLVKFENLKMLAR